MRQYLWKFDPARYSRAYLWGQVTEKSVVRDIVSYLSGFRIKADVVDSGGAGMRGQIYSAVRRAEIEERRARAVINHLPDMALAPVGFSDLSGVLAPDGRAFYIEVKAPAWKCAKTDKFLRRAGAPSPVQLAFLDYKAGLGAIVGVAWSMRDAMEIIGLDRLEKHKRNVKFIV
jgi:hypothetical protein